MTPAPKPKQKPRGAVAMGLNLFVTDKRARVAVAEANAALRVANAALGKAQRAQNRSVAAIWFSLLSWIIGGAVLAAWVVEWMG